MLWEGFPDEDSEVICVSDLEKNRRWKARSFQEIVSMKNFLLIPEGLLNRLENLIYGKRNSSYLRNRHNLTGYKSLDFPGKLSQVHFGDEYLSYSTFKTSDHMSGKRPDRDESQESHFESLFPGA